VCDRAIAPLLEGLRSSNASDAWVEFLQWYGPVLYQAARTHTSSQDVAAECYVYICEQLAHNRFKRLLKFNPKGRASFTTWLRVVVRNLCFDWQRSQSGRHRPFKSLAGLSPLELSNLPPNSPVLTLTNCLPSKAIFRTRSVRASAGS